MKTSLQKKDYLVIAFGILFVIYHIGQITLGSALLLRVAASPDKSTVALGSPAPVVTVQPLLGVQSDKSIWPERVVIPSLGVNLAISGSIEEQGAWEISETGANFALNTAIPNGFSGNTALFGHDRPKLFNPIHQLKEGDLIEVHTREMIYRYSVTGNLVVGPTDISVMDQTKDSRLTLVTCDGWLSENRYIVTANFKELAPNPDNFLSQAKPLKEGLVTFSFDDAIRDVFENALPVLTKYQIRSTQYLTTGPIANPTGEFHMTPDQVREFYRLGHEIAAHTITHRRLVDLSSDDLAKELDDPKDYLTQLLGIRPKNFAAPEGATNADVLEDIRGFYGSHRGTFTGFNNHLNLDRYNLLTQNIENNTTIEQIKSWINYAKENKAWLILTFHGIDDIDSKYTVSPSVLEDTLKFTTESKIKTVTVQEGLKAFLSPN